MKLPELLIPAGNLTKLRAALAYGADAVYMGAQGLSMRPDQSSISIEELDQAVEIVRSAGKRIYLGINSMFFEEDVDLLSDWIDAAGRSSVDAVIVSDAGAVRMIRDRIPEMKIHISTQMSVSNSEGARFWKEVGAERIVLARECSLDQASQISEKGDVEVEVFVHGAMCMAVSGRCILSAHLCGQSASRGVCKHSCRWEWQLVEKSRPGESMPVFQTDRETIFMGSSDLCLIQHVPELVKSGVSSLKIEGRMKSEYYVATVARVYRSALDAYAEEGENYNTRQEWLDELEAVSHRPYSTGFAFGYSSDRASELQTGADSIATHDFLGMIDKVCEASHTINVKNPFSVGEELEYISPCASGSDKGVALVSEILGPDGRELAKSHCGTSVKVLFAEGIVLPECSMLRRLRS